MIGVASAALACALWLASAPVAPAQTVGLPAPSGPNYLDSRERAARDLELLTQSASDLWSNVEAMVGSVYGGGALFVIGALLGGWVTAGRRRREPSHPAPRGSRRPLTGAPPPLAADADADAEARRLFEYFRERFGVTQPSAAAAIDYMTRLGDSIQALRQKLLEAERRAETEAGANGDPLSAMVGEALRSARAAAHGLRGDPDYAEFERVVGVERTLRGLAALRESGFADLGEMIEDPWPQALLRADALLGAYYPWRDDWRELKQATAGAVAGLRLLFDRAGVDVAFVRVLAPFEADQGEKWSDSAKGLADLAPVRRVLLKPGAGVPEGTVIDVESFGYVDRKRNIAMRSRLILFSAEKWLPAEQG